MGEMRRATAREEEERKRDRFASTLVIAASIIAAVSLARGDISRSSPRLDFDYRSQCLVGEDDFGSGCALISSASAEDTESTVPPGDTGVCGY